MNSEPLQCFNAPPLDLTQDALNLPYFKIFVVGCTVTWMIDLITVIRQEQLLRDLDHAQTQFDLLHPDIRSFYDWDKVRDSMRYQSALFSLKVIKTVYMMVYDVAFQCFLIPLMIWTAL